MRIKRGFTAVLISLLSAGLILLVACASPANFVLSNPDITPSAADTGDIYIYTTVSNTGGTKGNYEIVLRIDGLVNSTRKVTLTSGESTGVLFTVSKAIAGTHAVDINGKLGRFTVTMPATAQTTPSRPAGATALCRDGTYSYSASRSGTCSHHGGVAVWY